jgi:hypothetical protein
VSIPRDNQNGEDRAFRGQICHLLPLRVSTGITPVSSLMTITFFLKFEFLQLKKFSTHIEIMKISTMELVAKKNLRL